MRSVVVAIALAASATGLSPGSTEPPTTEPDSPTSPAEHCDQPDVEGEGIWLDIADDARVQAAIVGSSPTVAIFLHQNNGDYCGFAEFAAWLAGHDVQSILINRCGYGESECPDAMRYVTSGNDIVGAAAQMAVDGGAERVTIVGASVGGAQALTAAATEDVKEHIDAVVDLSGAVRYGSINSEEAASHVTVPVLMAGSETDRAPTVDDVRRIADLLGSDDVEVWIGPSGHGWDLLEADSIGDDTEFRLLVLDWITGERP